MHTAASMSLFVDVFNPSNEIQQILFGFAENVMFVLLLAIYKRHELKKSKNKKHSQSEKDRGEPCTHLLRESQPGLCQSIIFSIHNLKSQLFLRYYDYCKKAY